MENEDGKKYVKGATKFEVNGNNHWFMQYHRKIL